MINSKALSSSFWTVGVGVVDRLIAFAIYLVLARFLGVEEFGAVAFSILFIEFIVIVINSGIKELLVSKDSVNSTLINTCFYSVMLSAFFLIILFYFSIDFIFSDKSVLTIDVLKALAFLPIISSFNIIQVALLQREFSFKSLSLRSLLSTLLSGLVGILMAMNGFGAWALVFNKYIKVIIDTIFMLSITKFIPSLKFSLVDFKMLYRFGLPLLLSEVMGFWSSRVIELFVSFYFGPVYFALVDVGRKFSKMINQVSLTPLRAVCLSYVSKSKDKGESYAKFTSAVSILIAPALIFIGVYSEHIIITLLGHKWEQSIIVCQIVSFGAVAQCLAWYFSVPLIALNKTKHIFYVNLKTFLFAAAVGLVCYRLNFEYFLIAQMFVINLNCFYKMFFLYKINVLSFSVIKRYFLPVVFICIFSFLLSSGLLFLISDFFSTDFSVFNIMLLVFCYLITFVSYVLFGYVFFRIFFLDLINVFKGKKQMKSRV